MALSLTITDNGNGTGGVATITGTDPTSSNTVFAQSADANIASPNFASQGNRTGDGTIALATAAGIYWFYCLASAIAGTPTVSSLLLRAITTGQDALEEQIIKAVVSRLQVMNFLGTSASAGGIAPSSIYDQVIPVDTGFVLPALAVTLEGTRETIVAATNQRDDYGWLVNVAILDDSAVLTGDYKSARGKYLRWRQQIERAFMSQRLAGVLDVFNCKIEPAVVVNPKFPQAKYFVSGVGLRFFAREGRGFAA
jgi:hypothetical protein